MSDRAKAEELVRQYFEMQAELESHKAMVEDVRDQLQPLVEKLGKIETEVGNAVMVPPSVSHTYDTKKIDDIIITALANGDTHMATALSNARKDSPRKASMRISAAKK